MNRTNVEHTLNILKLAKAFDIKDFQSKTGSYKYAETVEELHACGNTACIAGYTALTAAWKEFGGGVAAGVPTFRRGLTHVDAAEALALFWGISAEHAGFIIYGDGYNHTASRLGLKELPHDWTEMTKDQAVYLFEQLLALDAAGVTL